MINPLATPEDRLTQTTLARVGRKLEAGKNDFGAFPVSVAAALLFRYAGGERREVLERSLAQKITRLMAVKGLEGLVYFPIDDQGNEPNQTAPLVAVLARDGSSTNTDPIVIAPDLGFMTMAGTPDYQSFLTSYRLSQESEQTARVV